MHLVLGSQIHSFIRSTLVDDILFLVTEDLEYCGISMYIDSYTTTTPPSTTKSTPVQIRQVQPTSFPPQPSLHATTTQSNLIQPSLTQDLYNSLDPKMSIPTRFKLVFFVPPAAVEACKTAIFSAGAGSFPGKGGYTECAFTSRGLGQFRPGEGANPHVSVFSSLGLSEDERTGHKADDFGG